METPTLKKLLLELRKLNLPQGKYAIFGSAPIAARGLRDCRDLDLVVNEELWTELSNKFPGVAENPDKIIIPGTAIELFKSWLPGFENVNELITSAEMIDGIPFVNLENVRKWKTLMGREKDKVDLELLESIQ